MVTRLWKSVKCVRNYWKLYPVPQTMESSLYVWCFCTSAQHRKLYQSIKNFIMNF